MGQPQRYFHIVLLCISVMVLAITTFSLNSHISEKKSSGNKQVLSASDLPKFCYDIFTDIANKNDKRIIKCHGNVITQYHGIIQTPLMGPQRVLPDILATCPDQTKCVEDNGGFPTWETCVKCVPAEDQQLICQDDSFGKCGNREAVDKWCTHPLVGGRASTDACDTCIDRNGDTVAAYNVFGFSDEGVVIRAPLLDTIPDDVIRDKSAFSAGRKKCQQKGGVLYAGGNYNTCLCPDDSGKLESIVSANGDRACPQFSCDIADFEATFARNISRQGQAPHISLDKSCTKLLCLDEGYQEYFALDVNGSDSCPSPSHICAGQTCEGGGKICDCRNTPREYCATAPRKEGWECCTTEACGGEAAGQYCSNPDSKGVGHCCPYLTHWANEACIPDCPAPQKWDSASKKCVDVCSVGQVAGSTCSCGGIVCNAGEKCTRDPATKEPVCESACPAGQQYIHGECKISCGNATCGSGQICDCAGNVQGQTQYCTDINVREHGWGCCDSKVCKGSLICRNNTCDCPDGTEWDDTKNRCVKVRF